jgi:hypothetical protein
MNTPEVVDENPYLALRAAKIARNNDKLKELGLLKPPPSDLNHQRRTETGSKLSTSNRQLERRQPTRRSTRIRPPNPGQEEPLLFSLETINADSILPSRKRLLLEDSPMEQTRTKMKSTSTYVFAANSVRRIEISVSETINKFLGRTMPKTGKACVIQTTLGGVNASFNKYTGVQEWGNDAIYLWVNIGNHDKNDIVNDFPKNGRQLTWFGGSRMHDDTSVIQKLLRIGNESRINSTPDDTAANSTAKVKNDDGSGIVLWCRHYNPHAKTYHPYTCLGRLSYESHVPGSQPLEFVWNLLDYDRLIQHEDKDVRARFQEIIGK